MSLLFNAMQVQNQGKNPKKFRSNRGHKVEPKTPSANLNLTEGWDKAAGSH